MTTDVLGDFTLGPGGELRLTIGGIALGEFDILDITGNLHLNGGTLDIDFINGFLPASGELWNILSFTGTEDGLGFSNVVFENAGAEQLTAFFNGQNFELADQGQAAPEPSSLSLILVVGLAGIVILARRRGSRWGTPGQAKTKTATTWKGRQSHGRFRTTKYVGSPQAARLRCGKLRRHVIFGTFALVRSDRPHPILPRFICPQFRSW